MPKVWYSIKMSALNSSLLCMEHDATFAMYANFTFAVTVFCWLRAPEKVSYSIRMSALNSSLLCMEHDETSALYANFTSAVSVFCFHAATNTL